MNVMQFIKYCNKGLTAVQLGSVLPQKFTRLLAGAIGFWAIIYVSMPTVSHAIDNAREINVVSMNSPQNLSLFDHKGGYGAEILYQNVYEGLVRYNANGKIVTGLAQAWFHNTDYTRWTLELRRNVTFHDGARFTADDVIFTFRNIKARHLGASNLLFKNIAFVKKESPWRIVFILKRPVRDFLKYLARPEAVIVNAATWFNNKTRPNGTGPYIYSSFEQGKQLVLLKNHGYWEQLGGINKVVYTFDKTIEQAVQGMQKGEYQGIIGVKNVMALSELDEQKFRVSSNTGGGILSLVVNQSRGALSSHPLRVAIAHALDRDTLVEQVMPNHASPAIETVMAYDMIEFLEPRYKFSLEKARDIINNSVYSEGLSFNMSIQDIPYMHRVANQVKHHMEQVNIIVNIIPIPVQNWYNHIHENKDFEIALTLSQGEFNILDYMNPNYFNYHNETINTMIDRVVAHELYDDKTIAMQRIQTFMSDDTVVIPLIKMNYVSAFRSEIKIPQHSSYRPQILFNESYIQY